jgi:hypothetical protein
MPLYPWNRNYISRKKLNSGRSLPDYNLDPSEDFDEDAMNNTDDIDGPDNWEEICQILGLHS